MQLNYNDLSLSQLQQIDDSLEEFIFAQPNKFVGEPFAKQYRKDPKLFRKIIRELVAFKKDLMAYFRNLYDYRWQLINYHAIPAGHVLMDEYYDDYFYDSEWKYQDQQLAKIVEKHRKKSYLLGLLSLLLLAKIATGLSPEDNQDKLTKHALDIAKAMNEVTKKRIAKAIEAALKLGEDRPEFEGRLKQVVINDTRARVIAENEALQSFTDARYDGAVERGLKYKTWEGVQSDRGEVCGAVIGETVPIDEDYSNGLQPVYVHVRCRCWEEYSYSMN